MFNKLLKRCMPWMQSGRWIRIYYDGLTATKPQDMTFRHPDNMTFSVSDDGWAFKMSFNRPVAIGDTHMTITRVTSDVIAESTYVFTDPSPGAMVGTKGYIDYYINDIEVI